MVHWHVSGRYNGWEAMPFIVGATRSCLGESPYQHWQEAAAALFTALNDLAPWAHARVAAEALIVQQMHDATGEFGEGP